MQTQADWSEIRNAAHIGLDFFGSQEAFKGPGLYLTKSDTLLITPVPPHNAPTLESIWLHEQPDGTLWRCDVYNCQFERTIFAAFATVPVKFDNRRKAPTTAEVA